MPETQQAETSPSTADRVMGLIKDFLSEEEGYRVKPAATFEDMEIDSMEKILIIQDVEKEFGIRIGDDHVERILTVEQLIKEVEDRTSFHKAQA